MDSASPILFSQTDVIAAGIPILLRVFESDFVDVIKTSPRPDVLDMYHSVLTVSRDGDSYFHHRKVTQESGLKMPPSLPLMVTTSDVNSVNDSASATQTSSTELDSGSLYGCILHGCMERLFALYSIDSGGGPGPGAGSGSGSVVAALPPLPSQSSPLFYSPAHAQAVAMASAVKSHLKTYFDFLPFGLLR